MPWIKRQAKEHSCKRPNINSVWRVPPQAGNIWQCGKCAAKWKVRLNRGHDGWYTPFYWTQVE